MPPALLVQGINHLGRYSLSEQDTGLRLANASTYCTLDRMCDPAYGLAASWRILLGLYVLYSCLAMFLDNVLADAMGVRNVLVHQHGERYALRGVRIFTARAARGGRAGGGACGRAAGRAGRRAPQPLGDPCRCQSRPS